MTAPISPDPFDRNARGPRGKRMNRSRAIAAGTSVGALIALTAGVAVANPGSHTSSPPTASNSRGVQSPSTGDDANGGDTGWLAPNDNRVDPNDDGSTSGWTPSQPDTGSPSFDPGVGADSGSTRSGGS
jgi:hypothetical protein